MAKTDTTFATQTRKTGVRFVCATTTDAGIVEIAKDDCFSISTPLLFDNDCKTSSGAVVVPTAKHLKESEIRSKKYSKGLFDQLAIGGLQELEVSSGHISWFGNKGRIMKVSVDNDISLNNPSNPQVGVYFLIIENTNSVNTVIHLDDSYVIDEDSPSIITLETQGIYSYLIISDGNVNILSRFFG